MVTTRGVARTAVVREITCWMTSRSKIMRVLACKEPSHRVQWKARAAALAWGGGGEV